MSIISAITLLLLGAALGFFAARLIRPKVDNTELEQELEVTRDNLKQQDVYWQLHKNDSLELLEQLDKTYSKLTQHLRQDLDANPSDAKAETESLSKPEVAEPIALTAVPAVTESEQKSEQVEIEVAVESVEKKDTAENKIKTENQDKTPALTAVTPDKQVETEILTEQQAPEKQRVNG